MADYPFKINIVTKNGTKISHFDEDFASDSDIAISASAIVTRINNMGTGASYVESIENVGEGSPSYGSTGGSVYLSASYTHPNTGSIVFTDTETTTNGGLDYYVFHGAKVCSVLGLPEGVRIYTENFKLSDSSTDTTNYVSGEFISDRVALKKGFKMSPQARMHSNLIWDEVFGEGMLQWVSGSNVKMSIGYDNVNNSYEVIAPIVDSNLTKTGTLEANTISGSNTSRQRINFQANDIEFYENNVEAMSIRDSFVKINPQVGDVDFQAFSSNGTELIHANAGTHTLETAGILDVTNTTDSSDATGDTGALRVEGGASIAKKVFVGTDLDVASTGSFGIVQSSGLTANESVIVGADGKSLISTDLFTFDTANERLGIGIATPEVKLHIDGDAAQEAQIRLEQHNNTADAPDIRIRRSRGTHASPSVLAANDYQFRLNVDVYDGSDYTNAGQLRWDNDGTTNNNSTNNVFGLQTRVAGTTADRLTIDASGNASFSGDLSVDGDITQGSYGGLTISSSVVFQVNIDSAQNINAGGAGTEFSPAMGTPSTKNTTYISHTNGGATFDLKVPGEYQITCDLVVTDSATNDRHTFFGYIEHLTSGGGSTIYKYPIGGVYIRSDVDGYDGGGLGGQARIITTTANERIRIRTIVLERQNSGTCNLDTSLSRVRVQYIRYGAQI